MELQQKKRRVEKNQRKEEKQIAKEQRRVEKNQKKEEKQIAKEQRLIKKEKIKVERIEKEDKRYFDCMGAISDLNKTLYQEIGILHSSMHLDD